MVKNKLPVIAIALVLVTLATFGAVNVFAQDSQNTYPPIIQKLAQKFGVGEEEVKSVFDEAKQERKSQMQASYEEFLDRAVKDGKITEEQKQKILGKRQELQINREANKQELQNWASENGIDLMYLRGGFKHHFGGMRGNWFKK